MLGLLGLPVVLLVKYQNLSLLKVKSVIGAPCNGYVDVVTNVEVLVNKL